jgi:hypothetical protein
MNWVDELILGGMVVFAAVAMGFGAWAGVTGAECTKLGYNAAHLTFDGMYCVRLENGSHVVVKLSEVKK